MSHPELLTHVQHRIVPLWSSEITQKFLNIKMERLKPRPQPAPIG